MTLVFRFPENSFLENDYLDDEPITFMVVETTIDEDSTFSDSKNSISSNITPSIRRNFVETWIWDDALEMLVRHHSYTKFVFLLEMDLFSV